MAKSKRKPALGRGLSALLNDPNKTIDSENDINSTGIIGSIIDLPLDKISAILFSSHILMKEESTS